MYERINLLRKSQEEEMSSDLLLPIALNLTQLNLKIMREYSNIFEEIGFEICILGETAIIIRKIPKYIDINKLNMSDLETKKQFVEQKEKDLVEKQRLFDIRMKEQSDRFLKDKKDYEQRYQEKLKTLEEREISI